MKLGGEEPSADVSNYNKELLLERYLEIDAEKMLKALRHIRNNLKEIDNGVKAGAHQARVELFVGSAWHVRRIGLDCVRVDDRDVFIRQGLLNLLQA